MSLGDFILLLDENGKEVERRKVNMVLSARSCGIEEPFTDDISEKREYYVQRKPKKREKERAVEDIVRERIGLSKGREEAGESG